MMAERDTIVHDRVTLCAGLIVSMLASANLLIRSGGAKDSRTMTIAVIMLAIGIAGVVLAADELVISGEQMSLRRWFGLMRRDYMPEDVQAVIVRGPKPRGTPLPRPLVLGMPRPGVRVLFRDGQRARFSPGASRTNELIEFAKRMQIPITWE